MKPFAASPRCHGWVVLETLLGLLTLGMVLALLTTGLSSTRRVREGLTQRRQDLALAEELLSELTLRPGDQAAAERLQQTGWRCRAVEAQAPEDARLWVAVELDGVGPERELFACLPRASAELVLHQPTPAQQEDQP